MEDSDISKIDLRESILVVDKLVFLLALIKETG
jgi:hypothetical protein